MRKRRNLVSSLAGEASLRGQAMSWTCDQIEMRLSDYLDGVLQGAERAEFDARGRVCAVRAAAGECAQRGWRNARDGPHGAPPRLMYAILDKTLGPRETVSTWQAVPNLIRGLATPKFAYGTASVMATFVILLTSSGFSLRKPKLADLRPANVCSACSGKRMWRMREA